MRIFFDIELEPCEPPQIIADNEKIIQKLVDENGTCSAGKCYHFIGTTVANGPTLLEATRRGIIKKDTAKLKDQAADQAKFETTR